MYSAFVIITLLAFAFLAWRDLRLGLALLIALLPTYLLRFDIFGRPSTWLEIATLILVGIYLLRERPTLRQLRDVFGPLTWPTVGLLIAATLGVFVANYHNRALGIWKAYFIEPVLVFAMLRTLFRATDWRRAFTFLGFTVIGISIYAVVQRLTGLGIPAPWDVELRVTSIFDFPNAVGLFLAPLVVTFACLAYELRHESVARWYALASLFGLVGVVLAQTEAALIAIPAGIVTFIVLHSKLSRRNIVLLGAGCVAAIALAFLVTPIREKVLLEDYSGLVRRSQWREAIEMLGDRPITGAGLSGYPLAITPYHNATLYEIFQYPHNIVLNVWSELGLLGLTSFVLGAIVVLRTLKKERQPAAVLAFAALITMTVHGIVDVPYFKNDLAILTWTFIALFLATPQLRLPSPKHESRSQPKG